MLNNEINLEEQEDETLLAQNLEPITAEEQAQQQTDDDSPPAPSPPPPSQGRYPGPVVRGQSTHDTYGATSGVDLSKKENVTKMWEEYNNAVRFGRKSDWKGRFLAQYEPGTENERARLIDAWYLKYYGMNANAVKAFKTKEAEKNINPLERINENMKGLTTLSLGAGLDPVMDLVGVFPGLSGLDDWYDKVTKSDNAFHQGSREFLSVVGPAILTGKFTQGQLAKLPASMSRAQKWLIATGAWTAESATITLLSDTGEGDNILRMASDTFPNIWGPKGSHPIPDWAKTLDQDSPSVRKWKNLYTFDAPLAVAGTTLGHFIQIAGKHKTMGWMQPLDEASTAYKQKAITDSTSIEKLLKIQEIDTQLSLGTENISTNTYRRLLDEREALVQQLDSIDNLDDALDALDRSATKEQNIAAVNKLKSGLGPNEFDPDVTPILNDGSNARQSVPPGNVARNMADTTAIKNGVSDGDPAPIITEAMRAKGLMVGSTSRDAILGVAEQARDTGRFNALVDGFRFSAKQMDEAAWAIYKDIVNPETSLEEVKKLFATNRDMKSLLLGKLNVEYINEEQARAAAFALRDLTDRFLGRKIAESSARVMDTLGREVSTFAEAIKDIEPFNSARAMDLIIDKMQFLLDEYALNKYISGWQLRNKNWFNALPEDENITTVIETLTEEFRTAENALHAKNLKFTKTLKDLAETNPLAMRPLVDAFAHTNGDVDSLAKLTKWADQQITATGMLKSPDPKELNLFARSAWGVIYNNVLSGISAVRALLGTTKLILKPITSILGHGIWGTFDDFEGLKRTFYYNGAVFETNRRALRDAFIMMKKAHKDPEFMTKAYRKDFIFQGDQKWDIMEDMRVLWEQEGNFGKTFQYDMAKTMNDMAKLPQLRYGMTGMVFSDAMTATHLAHWLARTRAYDDVFSEFGFADWKKIAVAEKKHYDTLFDANGLIKDSALKSITGEVALNLDDGLSNWINKGTTAYPISKFLFMFPRTGSVHVRTALSWTPLTLIPGINKYSKTLWARSQDDIAIALAEHGIDMATTPNAMRLFEDLRAEYTGRLAFSSLLTKLGWDYAMGGNIRGNGHYNASRRTKERDQLGYEPKTINIAGKWVSFKGIPGVDPILSILGDLAYYARDLDQPMMEDYHAKLMWTISATFLNETPLQGIEPLVAAFNGDLNGWSRLIANSARAMIPMSGALGVMSNAITSSQKDIQSDIVKYVQNKIPIASSFLPEQIDFWTGEPLNDIDNPFLRILNSLSPVKISGTEEPWRKWLLTTGWDGLSRLKKDSTGSYEYSPEEREAIYKIIGKMQLYKKLIPLMNNKEYAKQIGLLRAHRASGGDVLNEDIKLKTNLLPLFREIDKIVRDAQKIAEMQYQATPAGKNITGQVYDQKRVNQRLKQGDVQGAHNIQESNRKRKLLQYGGSR